MLRNGVLYALHLVTGGPVCFLSPAKTAQQVALLLAAHVNDDCCDPELVQLDPVAVVGQVGPHAGQLAALSDELVHAQPIGQCGCAEVDVCPLEVLQES